MSSLCCLYVVFMLSLCRLYVISLSEGYQIEVFSYANYVAELVAHLAINLKVVGSSPGLGNLIFQVFRHIFQWIV